MRRVMPPRRLDPRLIPAAALAAMLSLGCSTTPPTVYIANESTSQVEVRKNYEPGSCTIRPGHYRTLVAYDFEVTLTDIHSGTMQGEEPGNPAEGKPQ